MGWDLLETNTSGWKKFLDQWGNHRYMSPEGKFANSNAWSASFTKEGVTKTPSKKPPGKGVVTGTTKDVIGDVTKLSDGAKFKVSISGPTEARAILKVKNWEAFQITGQWVYDCKGSSDGPFFTSGFSRVHGDNDSITFQRPITVTNDEGHEEFMGYETVEGDKVSAAINEAGSNAFGIVDCSIIRWERIELSMIIYASTESRWVQAARTAGKVFFEGV